MLIASLWPGGGQTALGAAGGGRRDLGRDDSGAGRLVGKDGGLETTLIFQDGLDLPEFAAFPLLDDGEGRDALQRYYRAYADVCREHHVGFILESAM